MGPNRVEDYSTTQVAIICATRHSFPSGHSGSAMLLPLLYILFLMRPWSWGTPLSLPATPPRFALHLPLYRREAAPSIRRRAHKQDSIGLGDDIDVCGFIINHPGSSHCANRTYNVLVQVGETLTPVVLGAFHNFQGRCKHPICCFLTRHRFFRSLGAL